MLRIFNFSDFIKESTGGIFYVLGGSFIISDLLESGIYDDTEIREWMSLYNFDEGAHGVFVSSRRTSGTDFDLSGGMMTNRIYFKPTGKYTGELIDDSEVGIDGNDVSLYIFNHKKNEDLRKGARQLHGFAYEDQIKELNGLKEVGTKIGKWDCYGGLDKRFLETRLDNGYIPHYYNGGDYKSLVENDDLIGYSLIDIPDDILVDRFWNIKTSSTNEINMADFKNISGLVSENGILTRKETVDEFILAVSRRDISGIVEEYIVFIESKNWDSYLPDLSNQNVLDEISSLYSELGEHRIKEYSEETDATWSAFVSRYSKITSDSIIKLRFKRNREQLRIQCAISWRDFNRILEDNRHIKIAPANPISFSIS